MSEKHKLPDRMFVTGTDTGVGKTVVAAMLAIGLKAHYWKPIQSGTEDGTDTDWVQSVSKEIGCLQEVYGLRAPLSPHAAASLDGIDIDMSKIQLPAISPLIVEGAGGILVPLNGKDLMLNLIQQLSLPTLIVARSGLGTLNHTLLTIEVLRNAGVEIVGVIMNGPLNRSNKEAIEKYGQVRVLAEVPHQEALSSETLFEIFNQYFAVKQNESNEKYLDQTGTFETSYSGMPSCLTPVAHETSFDNSSLAGALKALIANQSSDNHVSIVSSPYLQDTPINPKEEPVSSFASPGGKR